MRTKWFNGEKKTRTLLKGLALFFSLALIGCAGHSAKPWVQPALADKPSVEDWRAYYVSQLRRNGAQVIHVGEEIRIVLRDDYLFNPDSANLRQNANPVLNWTAALIKTYTTVSIQVAGYSDNQNARAIAVALTTRQAQVVADSLWDKGIDTRLLSTVGYDERMRVDWNGYEPGRSFNRRVEICFRYYPRLKEYE